MPKSKSKSKSGPATEIRVLSPGEYPPEITARQGAHIPDVRLAAIHPLGLYRVEHWGAGHLQAMFTPRRGSRARPIGGASDVAGAVRRILDHEDELTHPEVPREEGRSGPVGVFSLGRRIRGERTPTQLCREIEAHLKKGGLSGVPRG
jgi:hypothetical protein